MTIDELLQHRMAGLEPTAMVILSLVGELEIENPVIPIDLEQWPSFRPLIGLDVQIAHVGKRIPELIAMADAIVHARPRHFSLWNVATRQEVIIIRDGIIDIHTLGEHRNGHHAGPN